MKKQRYYDLLIDCKTPEEMVVMKDYWEKSHTRSKDFIKCFLSEPEYVTKKIKKEFRSINRSTIRRYIMKAYKKHPFIFKVENDIILDEIKEVLRFI